MKARIFGHRSKAGIVDLLIGLWALHGVCHIGKADRRKLQLARMLLWSCVLERRALGPGLRANLQGI